MSIDTKCGTYFGYDFVSHERQIARLCRAVEEERIRLEACRTAAEGDYSAVDPYWKSPAFEAIVKLRERVGS